MHSFKTQSGRTIALLCIAVALARVAVADYAAPSLRSGVLLSEQLHREFDLSDGLPSVWINDVVQTRDGYVWIATDNGVVRYDGLHFRSFDRANTPHLRSNEIRVLFEDHEGSLWIGMTAGLARYRPGRPGTFEEVPAVLGKKIFTIWEDGANTLWIGTEEETWARGPELRFEIVEPAPTNVRAFCEDSNGQL